MAKGAALQHLPAGMGGLAARGWEAAEVPVSLRAGRCGQSLGFSCSDEGPAVSPTARKPGAAGQDSSSATTAPSPRVVNI